MKWLALFALAALCCISLVAQTSDPVQEPRYLNVFYALGAKGELVELEHQHAVFKSHVKSFVAYSSVKVEAEFKPAHSPVQLRPDVQFAVRGRLPLDPASRFELRSLRATKDHREIVLTQGHGSVVGASATSTFDEAGLPLRFEEYGQASYRITPAKPLEAGEYAIGMKGALTDLYCFQVGR